ncbi:MAG: nucleotidyltransferase family protein, partial [Actinomycetota bacterium]
MPKTAEGAIARRVAAYGLTPGEPIEFDPSWWGRIYGLIKTEHLSGLAAAAAGEGTLAVSDEQRDELAALHTDDMMWTLALERALLAIAGAAREDGVDLIVLKGPALAHTFYPDPSWRAFGDIDLLVRTRDWRKACALLERLGFHRQRPEPRAGFDERYGKAAVHVNGAGLNVDLHRTLVVGPFGLWMQPEELFERTVPFEVAGVALRRLDDTAILLHACVHAALGFMEPLLMPARDVAQVAQQGDVDWDEVGILARRWK